MLDLESGDLGTMGYLLPEDSQFRLKKLHGHMMFLSQLAEPRTHDEDEASGPEISAGELAVCMELLAEQVELVLDALTWPTERATGEVDDSPDEAASGEEEATAVAEFVLGVTLDQIDALKRLAEMLSAHGDVVTASGDAEFADATLPLVGNAIYEGAEALRRILRQVETQLIGRRVGEACAGYGSALGRPPASPLVPPRSRARRQGLVTWH